MLGVPERFDFSGPPPEPDWLIEDFIERGTVVLISADSGVGKSMVMMSAEVAMIQGRPWLGHATHGQRVMVIDEENFRRVVHTRLHAMGMTNADRTNMHYFLRKGVALGADDWAERVLEEVEDFKPDLLVIDTASSATAVEINDNSGVAKLFRDHIRPLADETAVVVLHHERKPQQGSGSKRSAGHEMMGARQWAGQADSHLACKKIGDKPELEPMHDGSLRKTFRVEMEMPKDRDGMAATQKLAIVSDHDPDGKGGFLRLARRLRVERIR